MKHTIINTGSFNFEAALFYLNEPSFSILEEKEDRYT
jgi:hypothetical protein